MRHLDPKFNERFIWIVTLVCAAYALWGAQLGLHHHVGDLHRFRQSQTALTAYFMPETWHFFEYATPVLGAPWAIPFELPVYQFIAALLWKTTDWQLDASGRIVSLAFHFATLPWCFAVLRRLSTDRRLFLIFFCLFVTSPHYLFWSRTFMIESTATFFGMAFLACAARAAEAETTRSWALLWATLFGIVAATVKITTFYGFALAAAGFVIFQWHRRERPFAGRVLGRQMIYAIFLAVLPLCATLLWTHYTDILKMSNPLAADFLVANALRDWTFGTWQQKLSWQTLQRFLGVTIRDALGHTADFYVFTLLACFVAKKLRYLFAVAVALFFLPLYTFTNLHLVHNYYAHANALFLIAAVSLVLEGFFAKPGKFRRLGQVALILTLASNVRGYVTHHYKAQAKDHPRFSDTLDFLAQNSEKDDVLLIYGLDWNPELSYLAKRKAIMLYRDFAPDGERLRDVVRLNQGVSVPYLLVCETTLTESYRLRLEVAWGLEREPLHVGEACEIYAVPRFSSSAVEKLD